MREGVLHALRPDSLQQTHRSRREQVCEGVLHALRPVYLPADTLPLGHRTQRYIRLQRAQPKDRRLADSL